MKLNRRTFLKNSAITTAGIGVAGSNLAMASSGRISANDKINIALIGCRKKGFGILKNSLEYDDVNCVAMCDVDENILNEKAGEIKNDYGFNPNLYKDYRKMLEQKDIDAVIIGTPDHWHCLNLVNSCEAGMDVYVEKPMANTIAECNIMTEAANYYDRVVQVGQQQRSNFVFKETMRLIKDGYIGNLRKVNIWANFNYGLGPDMAPDAPVPEGVDYDMWLGPASQRPFNPNRFHGSWRHFWDYGGGLMSDWGVHLLDMGLWVKDLVEAPKVVTTYGSNTSTAIRQRETFDTMNVNYPKDDYVIHFNMTAGVQQGPWEKLYGVAFVGEKGTIVTDRQSYTVHPEWDNKKNEFKIEEKKYTAGRESHSPHVRNFLDCVKSREIPVCPPEVGRVAAIHVHVPNIAARIGEPVLIWDDKNNRFENSEKANDYITPVYRNPWKLPKIG
jgi:predicted dehydrogenase